MIEPFPFVLVERDDGYLAVIDRRNAAVPPLAIYAPGCREHAEQQIEKGRQAWTEAMARRQRVLERLRGQAETIWSEQ